MHWQHFDQLVNSFAGNDIVFKKDEYEYCQAICSAIDQGIEIHTGENGEAMFILISAGKLMVWFTYGPAYYAAIVTMEFVVGLLTKGTVISIDCFSRGGGACRRLPDRNVA